LYAVGSNASVTLSNDGTIKVTYPYTKFNISASSPTYVVWTGDDPTSASFSIEYTGILRSIGAKLTSASLTTASVSGRITSTDGSIGGWTLSSNGLLSSAGNGVGLLSGGALGDVSIYAGTGGSATAPFRVTNTGLLTVSSPSFTGTVSASNITATGSSTFSSASISGNRILTTGDKLSAHASTTSAELAGVISDETGTGSLVFNTSPAFLGTMTASNATFSGSLTASTVNISGSITTASITSTSGSISGWVLSSSSLYTGTGATSVGLVSTPDASNISIFAGGSTASTAPFRLTNAGAMTASAPNFTGTASGAGLILSGNLTASAGTTTLGTTNIYDSNGINLYPTVGAAGNSEGGQINIKGGNSYTGQDWYFDNYQGQLRLIDSGTNQRIVVSGSTNTSNITLGGSVTTSMPVSNGQNSGLIVTSTDNVTANWNAIDFKRAGIDLGYIRVASAVGAPTLVSASDYRLKKNVQDDPTDFVNVIKGLRPVLYEWNNPEMGTGVKNGFIAHEVQQYIPQAVDGQKDAVDADGNIMQQTLSEQPFVYYMVGALKKAIAEIESLQSQVAELREQINSASIGG
jgi:hypothetical protein